MGEQRVQRRLAAIVAADVVGYSRLTGVDEEGTIAQLRALRRELIDPAIAAYRGRIVKTTGDGILIEFASVVEAVRSAVELQRGMAARNTDLPGDRRIEFRVGIHLGDVVVEGDDLLGEGVNVAARLEGIAEPGGICLSDDAYRHVKGKIDLAVRDLGLQRLKNIANAIHAYAIPANGAQIAGPAAAAPEPRAGAIGVVSRAELRAQQRLLRADTRKQRRDERRRPQHAHAVVHAPRLSIVVLPFANLGGDKEQDYFVDGITEGLTTDLCRVPGAFVIARNTAFTYKGKAVDARQIGRELGVRYVMEGSVQSGASRIRVNAQLVDAETGAHLWADRFDKPRADLLDMQDEITARLAHSLGLEIVAAEGRRAERERPNTMDSVDLTMRGWAILNQSPSSNRTLEARRLFEAALRLDERNVDALVGLAGTHMTDVMGFTSGNAPEQIDLAEAAIEKALSLAPDHPYAHHCRGEVLYARRAPEAALREFELALSLDRNLVWAYALGGLMKIFLGRAEETEADVAVAMLHSPREPALATWHLVIGGADLFLGRLDAAVEQLRKSAAMNPNFGIAFVFLAAAFALAGRSAEASDAYAAGRRLLPNFTIAKFRRESATGNPVYHEQLERVIEGMRKAGAPDE